jgi:CheY-like chemotaxis protein
MEGQLRTLIVDDDPDIREMVRAMLEADGYQVEEASNGREALEQIRQTSPNLVVLDIMMPELNGYDVVVHMKQQVETQNIPVMFVTAKAELRDLYSGYKKYGVEYYITKPFTKAQLLSGVRMILEEGKGKHSRG